MYFGPHIRNVGYMVMKYRVVEDGEEASKVMTGTASLYYQISKRIFVILTAAQNFI